MARERFGGRKRIRSPVRLRENRRQTLSLTLHHAALRMTNHNSMHGPQPLTQLGNSSEIPDILSPETAAAAV
jgi:hypothetical protein